MESLKKNRDFRTVYARGKSKASKALVIYWYPNDMNYNRYGFSISKKVGKAVVRNKIKRRLREIIRKNEEYIYTGYDIIFITRIPVINLHYFQLRDEVSRLLKKVGLWHKLTENGDR